MAVVVRPPKVKTREKKVKETPTVESIGKMVKWTVQMVYFACLLYFANLVNVLLCCRTTHW